MVEKIEKKQIHIETLLDKLQLSNLYYGGICSAIVGDILLQAEKEGITHLIVSESDYETIKRFMMANGNWNWDKKTFWGMEFVIKDK